MSKLALVLKIEFFEAQFKVHYTKGYKASYPIPLPTTVAGIFAAMLGMGRSDAAKQFASYKFGACLCGELAESIEQYTFLQYEKRRRGVTHMQLLVNPAYYLILACEEKQEIDRIERSIREQIVYYPFGGQNDFFAKNWSVIGTSKVHNSTEVANYAYSGDVKEFLGDTLIQILPVMHKKGPNEEFFFVLKGALSTQKELPVCTIDGKNIALYSLQDFYPVGEWSNEQPAQMGRPF